MILELLNYSINSCFTFARRAESDGRASGEREPSRPGKAAPKPENSGIRTLNSVQFYLAPFEAHGMQTPCFPFTTTFWLHMLQRWLTSNVAIVSRGNWIVSIGSGSPRLYTLLLKNHFHHWLWNLVPKDH